MSITMPLPSVYDGLTGPDSKGRALVSLFTLLSLLFFLPLVYANSNTQSAGQYELPRFLQGIQAGTVFPGADMLGAPAGEPPAAPVFSGARQIGYVFLNSDFVDATGYSGKPIHQLIAIDMAGVIQRVLLVEHHEPIVLIGIPERRITGILDDYAGLDIAALIEGLYGDHQVDIVTGATVTVMVMDDTIIRSAIKVARRYGLGGAKPEALNKGPKATVNMDIKQPVDWQTLQADQSVANLKMTLAQINQSFEQSGFNEAAARPEEGNPDEIFIDMYAAVVSVPSIGLSLLGEHEYRNLLNQLEPGQHAILLAGNGRFSYKGSGYVRGGIFDRFQIIQGDLSIRFHDYHHKRLRQVAADLAPDFTDVDLFITPSGVQFDPAAPWQLDLLVGRAIGATEKDFLTFTLDYRIPEKYLILPEPSSLTEIIFSKLGLPQPTSDDAPLWIKIWQTKMPEVIILSLAIILLTLIFFFQNWLTRRTVMADRVRVGFLIFTLFGIGWYANAQLSVVNILAVFHALISGFDWSYFLMEPLIFILWGSTAAALLFWGRGPYCGWLCPFGALQELLNRVAKWVKVPQLKLPWGLHERLWSIKYLIFLVLFGFSLHSLGWAERLAEVEPFKTAIILKFVREWPFVLFALAVIIPGLFIERFYCRYLCPLGAALAIPGRMRMFAWLKRYKECGTPCQICSKDCMVQAIHPEGDINVNECLYCLHCQVVYSDDQTCPVMIQRRQKRERRAARMSANSNGMAKQILDEIKMEKEKAKVVP